MSAVTIAEACSTQAGDTRAESGRPALLAEISRIKQLLCGLLDNRAAEPSATPCSADEVAVRLGLSPFERDLLMLCAAVELDSEFAELVSATGGLAYPTFALALSALPNAHWDALSPERPLRRWLLVDAVGAGPLATRALVLDEHVLHALTGVTEASGSLGGLVLPPPEPVLLTPRQRAAAVELAQAAAAFDGPVLLRVDGDDPDAGMAVAGVVADLLGLRVLRVRDAALADTDLPRMATILDREALLGDRLVLTGHDRLLQLLGAPCIVTTGADVTEVGQRTLLARTVDLPVAGEQADLWHTVIGPVCSESTELGRATVDLAHHYRLSARGVGAIAGEWAATTDRSPAELRRLTRERARVGLGGLADRIETLAGWEDLVVPAGVKGLLRDLTHQVRHRVTVYDDWGFGRRSNRGMGISALFAGESGTGKTMAAEVIAGELGLDLYRVELSAVMSKYIGETEKNLRRVFDAAETSGAVLLFDEADAIFSRRTEVKDSHDRYANLEVAYLLQRMENYRGLAILTTNLRSNVDRAFLRRLRFVVQFPFPDHALRAEIWRHAFPPQTPVDDVNPDALAHLQIAGGSIHAIAIAAAFAAADEGAPVRADHILQAAKVDYTKAERTLTDTEVRSVTGARP
jgi:ATPase family associated with various cellular activities (AAA)